MKGNRKLPERVSRANTTAKRLWLFVCLFVVCCAGVLARFCRDLFGQIGEVRTPAQRSTVIAQHRMECLTSRPRARSAQLQPSAPKDDRTLRRPRGASQRLAVLLSLGLNVSADRSASAALRCKENGGRGGSPHPCCACQPSHAARCALHAGCLRSRAACERVCACVCERACARAARCATAGCPAAAVAAPSVAPKPKPACSCARAIAAGSSPSRSRSSR